MKDSEVLRNAAVTIRESDWWHNEDTAHGNSHCALTALWAHTSDSKQSNRIEHRITDFLGLKSVFDIPVWNNSCNDKSEIVDTYFTVANILELEGN